MNFLKKIKIYFRRTSFGNFYYSYYNLIVNCWRLRKELKKFRDYDFEFNLNLFVASLVLTQKFLASNKAISSGAEESAKSIGKFISYIEEYRNCYDIAETNFDSSAPKFFEKVQKVEDEAWNNAFDHLKNNFRLWWD